MGWFGNFLIIFGAWQIGYKRRWGFLVTFSGGLCWVVVGIKSQMPDLIFIESVMGLVALRNFLKWRKI